MGDWNQDQLLNIEEYIGDSFKKMANDGTLAKILWVEMKITVEQLLSFKTKENLHKAFSSVNARVNKGKEVMHTPRPVDKEDDEYY